MTRHLACLFIHLAAVPAQADLLTTPPYLAHIEALPRLKANGPAAARITADPATRGRDDMEFAMNCAAPITEAGALVTDQTGTIDRQIDIGTSGPVFLSILVTVGAYCPGAAHGLTALQPLTYDL